MEEIPAPPVFMFHSRSADARPGRGANEIIDDAAQYAGLAAIPHWRRKLSNFYARDEGALFVLDGRQWRSAEHYFHAQKFVDSHPEYATSFALDSGSELSRAVGGPVKRAGRAIKMTPAGRMAWDNGGARRAMIAAQTAKFGQNPDLAQILLLTRNAILTHQPGRCAPVVEHDLMTIRDMMREARDAREID